MTGRAESKRFDPGKVCTYPGRLSRSWRGFFGLVLKLENWMTLYGQRLPLPGLLECYPSFWDGAPAGGQVRCWWSVLVCSLELPWEEGLGAVRAGSLGESQCRVHGGPREERELALFSCPAERSEVWDHPGATNTVYEELGSRDPHWN